MNIKEHIDAGHYPKDEKGRSLVPMKGGSTFCVVATDKPGTNVIVGWELQPGESVALLNNFPADSPSLLPPEPRKEKVTAWAVQLGTTGGFLYYENRPQHITPPRAVIELTGERVIPWERPKDDGVCSPKTHTRYLVVGPRYERGPFLDRVDADMVAKSERGRVITLTGTE